jgi:hypothetical protein
MDLGKPHRFVALTATNAAKLYGQFLHCAAPATAKSAPRPGAKRPWLTRLGMV